MCSSVSFCKRCTKIGSEISGEKHWNEIKWNEMTQMYSKYVFAQDVFDLCKLEISNSQPWRGREKKIWDFHMHCEHGICAEICSWQFLHRSQVVFLAYISIITCPIQAVAVCRKVFDNNPIELRLILARALNQFYSSYIYIFTYL